jgi:hypothetical protein
MANQSSIIRVKDIKDYPGLPARTTLYKLHSLRKYPRLIYTVPGAGLVFDLVEWQAMCEAAKQSSEDRAARVHKPLVEC